MANQLRKWLVSLKRHPHYIPLALLSLCCVVYTFQLTAHSNAAMYVSSQIIALYVFIITLFSILTIFSFLNAYGKRQKKRKRMLAIVYLLAGVQVVLDILYLSIIDYETVVRENPVPTTLDIANSYNWTLMHLILLTVSILTIFALPLYRGWLQKIKPAAMDDEFTDLQEVEEDTWV